MTGETDRDSVHAAIFGLRVIAMMDIGDLRTVEARDPAIIQSQAGDGLDELRVVPAMRLVAALERRRLDLEPND
jgi:hypothetical protein